MINLLLRFYRDRFLSRWIVLLFELIATLLGLIASIALRFNFFVNQAQRILNFASFNGLIIVGSHKIVLRYTSLEDLKKVLKGSLFGFDLILIISSSQYFSKFGTLFPISILSFHFGLTTLGLIALRLVAKRINLSLTSCI